MKHFSQIWKIIQWIVSLFMLFWGIGHLSKENYSLAVTLGGGFSAIFLWLWDIEQRIKDIQNKS